MESGTRPSPLELSLMVALDAAQVREQKLREECRRIGERAGTVISLARVAEIMGWGAL